MEDYQQRLQAIAEKRRLQEEQERAKREIEDERIRLQQLKRKSLRDQWLMEGPPASPDSSGPRSPLWGPQAQEIEDRIDKLQTETKRLAEEEERLTEHMEDGSVTVNDSGEAAAGEESADAAPPLQPAIVENGQQETAVVGVVEVTVEKDLNTAVAMVTSVAPTTDGQTGPDRDQPSPEELGQTLNAADGAVATATTVLPNGGVEGKTARDPPEQEAAAGANGPTGENGVAVDAVVGEGAVTMTFLGFSEAEPGQGVVAEDDVRGIIRAERVIITEEGDELPREDGPPAEEPAELVETPCPATPDTKETPDPETPDTKETPDPETPKAAAAEPEAEPHLEPSADAGEPQVAEAADSTTEAAPGARVEERRRETEGDGAAEAPSGEAQLRDDALEGAAATSPVPVYSAAQPLLTPRPDAEGEAGQPEEAKGEEAPPVETPVPAGQFQEVPLDGAGDVAESSAKLPNADRPAEQEPLLASKDSPQTEAAAPSRAEGGAAPKQKTCQCCSVM